MIAMELAICGDAGWLTEQDLPAFPRRHVGVIMRPGLEDARNVQTARI
jgi:hypothetical protein